MGDAAASVKEGKLRANSEKKNHYSGGFCVCSYTKSITCHHHQSPVTQPVLTGLGLHIRCVINTKY